MKLNAISQVIAVIFASMCMGCGSPDCIRRFPTIVNQNGTRSANLEISACGGATVGYVTDLKLTRLPRSLFGDSGNVWTVKTSVDADLTWITPTRLEVGYRAASFKEEKVIRRMTRWYDVDITYRLKAADRDFPSQH